MRILYVGDIMARPGRHVIRELLPAIRRDYQVDLVIGQAENVSHGKSMSQAHMNELRESGVDFFTGGNHTTKRPDLHDLLANPAQPVICPANLEDFPKEWGIKVLETAKGKVLIASILGQTFPTSLAIKNPLAMLDDIFREHLIEDYAAIVINFHGDFSSEKRVIGYYSDGRATAVIGDHWHVPTADAMVLPSGTAHITDVGMCGTLHSSLGVELEMIMRRWRDETTTPNRIAENLPYQFNAVLFETDETTHLAKSITSINKIIEEIA